MAAAAGEAYILFYPPSTPLERLIAGCSTTTTTAAGAGPRFAHAEIAVHVPSSSSLVAYAPYKGTRVDKYEVNLRTPGMAVVPISAGTHERHLEAVDFLDKQVGLPYNYSGYVNCVVNKHVVAKFPPGRDSWFCSELCLAALQKFFGMDPQGKHIPATVSPNKLYGIMTSDEHGYKPLSFFNE